MRDDTDAQEVEHIAPQHGHDLEEVKPYIIEGVAYSPLKMTYLHNYDDDRRVFCESCGWETTVGDLPEDNGRVRPDLCPDCTKKGKMGFVRTADPNSPKIQPSDSIYGNGSSEAETDREYINGAGGEGSK